MGDQLKVDIGEISALATDLGKLRDNLANTPNQLHDFTSSMGFPQRRRGPGGRNPPAHAPAAHVAPRADAGVTLLDTGTERGTWDRGPKTAARGASTQDLR